MSGHQIEKVISNTALITGANLLQKALSFLYFWFLSSRYAPSELGSYLWVLSLSGLFVTGIDLGLTPMLTREAARFGADGKKLTESVLWMKLPLAAASIAALWGTVLFSRRDPVTIAMTAAASGIMLFDGLTMALYAALRAVQKLRPEAVVLVSFQGLVLILGMVITVTTRSLPLLVAALFCGSMVNFVIMQGAARRAYGAVLLPRRHRELIRRLWSFIPAFAGNAVVTKVYSVGDVILLGYLAGNAAVGIFSIPAKVATALQTLIPAAFATAIYPSMAHFASTDVKKLQTLFIRSALYVFMLGLPVSIGLSLLAKQIMSALWPAYEAGETAFAVMMLGIPFIFLTYSSGSLLNAIGRERRATANRAVNTAFNIGLNIALIPRYGALGAAAAYAASNLTLLLLDIIPAARAVPADWNFVLRRGSGTVGAALGLAATVFFLRSRVPFWQAIIAAGAVYVILIVVFRALRRGEWNAVRDLFRRRELSAESYVALPTPDA